MALCVAADAQGVLHFIAVDPTACQGGVVLSSQEYSVYVGYTTMPPTADLSAAFGAGFTIPMTGFLVAYCAGRIVAMFNGDS